MRKPAAVPARTVVRRIIPQSRSTIALGRAAGIPGPRLCPLRTSRSNVQIAGIARFFEILAKEAGSSSSPTGLGNPPLGGGGRTPDSVFDGAWTIRDAVRAAPRQFATRVTSTRYVKEPKSAPAIACQPRRISGALSPPSHIASIRQESYAQIIARSGAIRVLIGALINPLFSLSVQSSREAKTAFSGLPPTPEAFHKNFTRLYRVLSGFRMFANLRAQL